MALFEISATIRSDLPAKVQMTMLHQGLPLQLAEGLLLQLELRRLPIAMPQVLQLHLVKGLLLQLEPGHLLIAVMLCQGFPVLCQGLPVPLQFAKGPPVQLDTWKGLPLQLDSALPAIMAGKEPPATAGCLVTSKRMWAEMSSRRMCSCAFKMSRCKTRRVQGVCSIQAAC